MTTTLKIAMVRFLAFRRVDGRWRYWCRARGRTKDALVAFLAPFVGEGNVLVLERDEIESDRVCESCGHPDTADNPVRGEADECEQCGDRRCAVARLHPYYGGDS